VTRSARDLLPARLSRLSRLSGREDELINQDWFVRNRHAVNRRLAWLQNKPKGVIYEKRSPLHRIVINRENGLIRMYFVDPKSVDEVHWSGAMSALQLDDPFDLSPTPYNQAMMLTLLWQNQPERVYMAGFAGGRIPSMFYHYFPRAVIESTDIDEDVFEIAKNFFGVEYDHRQRVFLEDGRTYLEKLDETSAYDFIFVDVFRGTGFSPPHLATVEFYELCRRHLRPGGVVAANLVESDELFGDKIATFASCFDSTYVQVDRTIVLFGTNSALLDQDDIVKRAEALQAEHNFSFPFVERAATLRPLDEVERLEQLRMDGHVLTDTSSAAQSISLQADDPLFYNVGRNDLCPCGSGKKFKKCHGHG